MIKTPEHSLLLTDVADISFGTSLTRIDENSSFPEIEVYAAEDHQANTARSKERTVNRKRIRASKTHKLLQKGDIVLSMITGNACIIPEQNNGMILSSNYVLIHPHAIDPNYLIFLLNEDPSLQNQLTGTMQGLVIRRIGISDLKQLKLPPLPDLNMQKKIGTIYLHLLDLLQLQKQHAKREKQAILECLRKAIYEKRNET